MKYCDSLFVRDYILPSGNTSEFKKVLLYLEMNKCNNINFESWFAELIIKNYVNMIAMLNMFIRETNTKIEPIKIYKELIYAEMREDTRQLEKIHGKGVCITVNCSVENVSRMMEKYPNLINKKYK